MAAEHEYNTHLKENTKGVTNVVGIEFLETLSTIAALKEESVAKSCLTQSVLEFPSFSGEDDWREGGEGVENGVELLVVGVFGELESLHVLPAVQGPCFGSGGCGVF